MVPWSPSGNAREWCSGYGFGGTSPLVSKVAVPADVPPPAPQQYIRPCLLCPRQHLLFLVFGFQFIILYVYECFAYMYVYLMCLVPESEGGTGYPRTGVTGYHLLPSEAGNQTLALRKSG